MPRISIIAPVFNERDCIDNFIEVVTPIVSKYGTYELIFVDDGSTDGTAEQIKAHQAQDGEIRLVKLARNHGKEIALQAGFEHCEGDCAIPMDVDLQDPPELIEQMLEKWEEGYELVNAKRVDRSDESYLKSKTAAGFYAVFNQLSKTKIPPNVGDFRLIDRRIIDSLKNNYPERNRFLKGLLALINTHSCDIEYKRPSRLSGKSKYPPSKLFGAALDGITAFSTAPISLITVIGFIIGILSFVYLSVIIVLKLFFAIGVPGYASLIATILLLGGFQIFALGLIGSYIGKIYIEVKGRPLYTLKQEKE